MSLIINPGSRIGAGAAWTNTYEQARKSAEDLLVHLAREGHIDVTLLDEFEVNEGRWVFSFRHNVTGKVVEFETHGIDDLDAYEKAHIFSPRVYWNGSSCSSPKLDDWDAEGFEPVKTFRPAVVA